MNQTEQTSAALLILIFLYVLCRGILNAVHAYRGEEAHYERERRKKFGKQLEQRPHVRPIPASTTAVGFTMMPVPEVGELVPDPDPVLYDWETEEHREIVQRWRKSGDGIRYYIAEGRAKEKRKSRSGR